MPPRDYYRATRSSRSSGGAPPGERGGGGYTAPSKPKSFVDKSVSTSDVATGKFTGGTQRATPKIKPDKTFSPPPDKGEGGTTGGPAGLGSPPPKDKDDKKKKYITGKNIIKTGLATVGGLAVKWGLDTAKDIRNINRWSKMYGPFTKIRPMSPSLMAQTSGNLLPAKEFKKTGHVPSIKNWFFSRTSP